MHFADDLLGALIKRLERINRTDDMVKEDADELLFAAICLNYQYFSAEKEVDPTYATMPIKKVIQIRIQQTLEKLIPDD